MTFEELVKLIRVNDNAVTLPYKTVLEAVKTTKPSLFDYDFGVLGLYYNLTHNEVLDIQVDAGDKEYIECELRSEPSEDMLPIAYLDPEVLDLYYKGNIDLTETPMKEDVVNHPSHYTQGTLEVIDIMDDKMSPEEFKGFLKGNVLKYLFRSPHKGTEKEDLEKCSWYLNRLIRQIHEENWGE